MTTTILMMISYTDSDYTMMLVHKMTISYICRYKMWTRVIALYEEHGIIPSGGCNIDINGISEIKNADELRECFQNRLASIMS